MQLTSDGILYSTPAKMSSQYLSTLAFHDKVKLCNLNLKYTMSSNQLAAFVSSFNLSQPGGFPLSLANQHCLGMLFNISQLLFRDIRELNLRIISIISWIDWFVHGAFVMFSNISQFRDFRRESFFGQSFSSKLAFPSGSSLTLACQFCLGIYIYFPNICYPASFMDLS